MIKTVLSVITFCCLLFSSAIFAQPTASWLISSANSTAGGSLMPGNGGMKTDSMGNSYIFASVRAGTVRYGALSLDSSDGGNYWLYIAKIGPTGNPLWIKGITCSSENINARTIAVNENGYISVGADYSDATVTFDATHSISTKNYNTYFVAGYDSAGNFLWVNTPDTSGPAQLTGLFISRNNSTYCVGDYIGDIMLDSIDYPSIEGTSIFITKLNASGKVAWFRQGTTSDNAVAEGQKITAYNGVLYMAGFFTDSVTFNSTTIYGNNNQQIYLAKYDTAGNLQWLKSIGGSPGGGDVTGLGMDENYNINLSGSVDEDGAVFGGDTIPGVADSNGAFVLGCDSSGTFKWVDAVYSPNGSTVYDLATGKMDGSTYVVGSAYDTALYVGSTLQTYDSIGGTGSGYGFLLKFNSAGQLQWNKIFGQGGYADAEEIGLQEYQLTVAGGFNSSLTVDNLTVTGDAFAQVYLCSFPLTPTAGISEVTPPVDWKVFPVPSNNKVTIESGGNVSSQLSVTDLSGQVLSSQIFSGSQTTLSLGTLPPGVYILTMQNNDGSNSSKLIVIQ